MKPFLKVIAYLSIIPLLIGLFFFSNIKGYYRFKSYCENEGGLRVFEKLERNVGWVAPNFGDARVAAILPDVSFVRFEDKADGKNYDLKYVGGNPQDSTSYQKIESDNDLQIKYKFIFVNKMISDELRLGRYGYEVSDYSSNKILVRYHMFSYSFYDRANTLFDRKSVSSCFDERDSVHSLPKSLSELITSFNK